MSCLFWLISNQMKNFAVSCGKEFESQMSRKMSKNMFKNIIKHVKY